MVYDCIVPGCTNYSHRKPNLRFHGFPFGDPLHLEQWVSAVNRQNWTPTKNSKICSDHFTENDYSEQSVKLKPRLKSNAVPSLLLPVVCEHGVVMEVQDLVTNEEPITVASTSQEPAALYATEIPLNIFRLKSDACPSIFSNSPTTPSRKKNKPRKRKQKLEPKPGHELELELELEEPETNVPDQPDDVDTNKETDVAPVKSEDLIEFEYIDVKKLDDEQSQIFNILWSGYLNLPNEFWAINKVLKQKKYILITKSTVTDNEFPVQEKQVLIREDLSLKYYVVNKRYEDTKCMPLTVASVEEIENVVQYFDGLLVCKGGPRTLLYPCGVYSSSCASPDLIFNVWRHRTCSIVVNSSDGNVCSACSQIILDSTNI